MSPLLNWQKKNSNLDDSEIWEMGVSVICVGVYWAIQQ
jgi:hypothetical protein